jgi:predicted amidohydrolase YtcJ
MNDSPLRLRCSRLALVAALAALPSTRGAAAETADLILTGARVWTAETKTPWAEAVAIRGERIVYVGSAKGAASLRSQKTEVRDLNGALILPGLNDSHVHLMEGAESLEKVDVIEDATLEAVQQHIKSFASENAKSPWVLGRGWFYGTFPGGLPTRAQLDAVVPDRPAYITCYDGHSGWANSKALALAGITRETKDPENGVIVRDPATGEATGALKEAATDLVESKIPKPDAEARYGLLLRALSLLNSQGITSVQDAGSSDPAENAPLYARARQYGRLSVRLSIATLMKEGDVERPIAQAQRLRTESADHVLRYGTIKGFVDGVIEAKTAAVLDPYPDGGRGLPNWQPDALKAAVVAADKAGLQVYLHAIGDRGVRMALDAHEAAAKANGPRDRRGRIEHIETISAADYPRFAALGVIASMQPLHADPNQNLLEVWAKNAGPDRASRGFSWANLERAGARLAFGSDWPVVTSDVRRGLYCAVTRKTREGTPAGGWHPEMAVSLDSALRHYTIDAAYASFEEGVKGSLAPGKLADLVVLADDIFKTPPETILKTKIVLTMLGGKVVYKAD